MKQKKKLNEERLAQAIKDFIKNESYMNFITGKFDYIFEKDVIEIQETKLLEGKLFSLYVLTNQNCLTNKKNLKGGTKLSEILKKNNSHYFPNDSATSKTKIMNKIRENAITSKILQEEEIQKIYDKYTIQEASILPFGSKSNNDNDNNIRNERNLSTKIKKNSINLNINFYEKHNNNATIKKLNKKSRSKKNLSKDKNNIAMKNVNTYSNEYNGLNPKYNTVYTDKKEKSIIDLLEQNKKNKLIQNKVNRKILEYSYNEKIIQEISSSKRFINENKSNENSLEKKNQVNNESSLNTIYNSQTRSSKNIRMDYKLKVKNKSTHKLIIKPSMSTFFLPVVQIQNPHKPELNEAINICKDKMLSMNRKIETMSNVEKKRAMNEIDHALKTIVYKRTHEDEYHKELLKIIKK